MLRAIKIELKVNNKEKTKLAKHAGVARHAYNQGLAYCNELFEKGIKTPSSIELHKWLNKEIKPIYPWYREVSKWCGQQALRDLSSAFSNFHRNQKSSGYKLKDKQGRLKYLPNFKKKGQKDSFYLEVIKIENNKIKLPIIGWISLKENIEDREIKNCRVSRHAGKWFVSFNVERNKQYTQKRESVVGVDLGIKTLATLSNGETFENVKAYQNNLKKLKELQREMSRRYVKGAEKQSKNYEKSKRKVAKLHKRIGDLRKDNLHKLTTYLAKEFETIVIEDLKPSKMSKNSRLASYILDGGFYEFKRQLTYKKEMYGGRLIIANQFFPSSKKCSSCGNIKQTLSLSERQYNCSECELSIDRDLNASLNLVNLNKTAVSSTVVAFGDELEVEKSTKIVDELGNKHHLYTFV